MSRSTAKRKGDKNVSPNPSQLIPIFQDQQMPQAPDLEMAVIGACIVDSAGFPIVSRIIKTPKVFYDSFFQLLFKAMIKLKKSNSPIDLLTIHEQLGKMKHDYEHSELMERLLQVTNKVASSANTEHHTKIIYQKYMRRQLIIKSHDLIKEAFENSNDVFDIYNDAYQSLRVADPSSILKIQSMSQALVEGKKEERSKHICGPLLRERDIAIVFGDEGTGKSILAYQFAKGASEGKAIINDQLNNECSPKKVIFIDFELQKRELWDRYSHQDIGANFNDNFFRASIDETWNEYDNIANKILDQIEVIIQVNKPELIVLDNITWIVDDATDNTITIKIMKKLMALRNANDQLTFLVVAHTPKRDTTQPLESRHLAGSKSLSNYCTNLIGISPSKLDGDLRYIKHLKCRGGRKKYIYDNVLDLALDKKGAQLQFYYHGESPEKDHLEAPDMSEHKEAILEMISSYRDKGYSFRDIAMHVNVRFHTKMSHTTVKRKYDKMNEHLS